MSKAQTKAVYSSDSESDISEIHEENEANDDFESDNEDDAAQFEEATDILASSTQIEPRTTTDIKLKIAGLLRKHSCAKSRHSAAVKRIPWEKLDGLDGYQQSELQTHLQEIIKLTGTVRTLDEVLADYEDNYVRYSIYSHPDHPTRPSNAPMRYILEHREKLTQQVEKEKGKSASYVEVFKYGIEKFKTLPEKKRSVYIDKYKSELDEYKRKKKELFENHPELRKAQKRVKKGTAAKSVKKSSIENPDKVLTPFLFYRQQEAKKENALVFSAVQSAWKNMSEKDKGKYVADLVNLETDQEKKISNTEMKFMERYNGLPDRPLSAYNIFVQNFRANYEGDTKEFMAKLSIAWKGVNDYEKQQLQEQSDALNDTWKRKMEVYIRNFPKDQQPMMFAKYNLFKSTKDKSLKRSSKVDTSQMSNHALSPPSKMMKTMQEDMPISPAKSPKKSTGVFKQEKVDESTVTSSAQKKKKVIKEPELPSQTTAHYYMTKIYKGKPRKIAKSYQKLDKTDKLVYNVRMRKQKKEYNLLVDEYVKSLSQNQIENFKHNTKEAVKKQMEEIEWHESTGTDKEKSSDNEDSGDSDSS